MDVKFRMIWGDGGGRSLHRCPHLAHCTHQPQDCYLLCHVRWFALGNKWLRVPKKSSWHRNATPPQPSASSSQHPSQISQARPHLKCTALFEYIFEAWGLSLLISSVRSRCLGLNKPSSPHGQLNTNYSIFKGKRFLW